MTSPVIGTGILHSPAPDLHAWCSRSEACARCAFARRALEGAGAESRAKDNSARPMAVEVVDPAIAAFPEQRPTARVASVGSPALGGDV